jgi:hypothetical protein
VFLGYVFFALVSAEAREGTSRSKEHQAVAGQQPQLQPDYPPGLYDESKIPQYSLPDPLFMLNCEKVTDTKTCKEKHRLEILKLFEAHVYGRTMIGRPKEMTWEVTSINSNCNCKG